MPTQKQRSQATRGAMLDQAAQLFARHGFEGTSLAMLSKAAGVNAALVSYHFGGKKGLYESVLLASIRRVAARLEPARDTSVAPAERMRRFIRCLADAFADAPEFPFIILREEMSGGHRIGPKIVKEFIGFFELDRDILAAGEARGEFRPLDAHEFHLSLIGGLVFFLASQPFRNTNARNRSIPTAPRQDAYVEHMTDIFMRGLRAT